MIISSWLKFLAVHSLKHFSLGLAGLRPLRQGSAPSGRAPPPQAGAQPWALRVQAEGWAHQGHSAGLVLIGSEAASGRESVVTSPVCSWEVERLLLVILSGSRDGLCLPDSQLLSSGFPARHPLFWPGPSRGCGRMTRSLLGLSLWALDTPRPQPGRPSLCNPSGLADPLSSPQFHVEYTLS